MRSPLVNDKTNSTPLLTGIRYTTVGAWFNGYLDGPRGTPTKDQEAIYEKLVDEHFFQLAVGVEQRAAKLTNDLERTRQMALEHKAALEAVLPTKTAESEKAAPKFHDSFERFAYSAWSFGGVALVGGLFTVELPLNFIAFSGQGDAPAFTMSAVLAVSAVIPAAAHMIGERLKRGSTITGVSALILLFGLVTCIALFRMRSFEEMALQTPEIARLSPLIVMAFYLILQGLLVFIAVQKAHANSRSFEKVEAIEHKINRVRFIHASRDLEKVREGSRQTDQTLRGIEVEMARIDLEKALELNALQSKRRELVWVYRKSNERRRKAKMSPVPDFWRQRAVAEAGLQGASQLNGNGRTSRNGNGKASRQVTPSS